MCTVSSGELTSRTLAGYVTSRATLNARLSEVSTQLERTLEQESASTSAGLGEGHVACFPVVPATSSSRGTMDMISHSECGSGAIGHPGVGNRDSGSCPESYTM